MCFVRIAMQAFYIREDGIGEMVVFINEEINLLIDTGALRKQIFELADGSVFFVHFFFDSFR